MRSQTNCAALTLSLWSPFKLTLLPPERAKSWRSNSRAAIFRSNCSLTTLASVFAENSEPIPWPGNWRCFVSTTRPSSNLPYSLLPGMLERQQKGIFNISSSAGFQPIRFASAYSATMAFLTTFSLALEQELRSAGVTVVTVCPGRLRKTQNGESEQPATRKWDGIYQSPEQVVEEALRVLANGGGLTGPGALNKFSVFAQRLIPRSLVPRLVAKMSRA